MRTHGHARPGKISTEYRSWQGMKLRCSSRNQRQWHRYGGRGISVCPQWVNSFEQFLEDMGSAPGTEYSLDRIDNDKNYEPANCKWSTRKEQCRNTVRNRYFELKGERLTLIEWSEKTGIPRTTICQRIDAYSWSVERALTTLPQKRTYK